MSRTPVDVPNEPASLVTQTLQEIAMYAMPEQLARDHQYRLLSEAEQDRRARVLLRVQRAERRLDRRRTAAQAHAHAAQDAARYAALVSLRADA